MANYSVSRHHPEPDAHRFQEDAALPGCCRKCGYARSEHGFNREQDQRYLSEASEPTK